MCSARLSDSPKDSYFAGAPSLRKESENFSMDSAASPGGTAGTGDGSPVRRTRSRTLHAAVISLELKGEDRCLVRMDVSLERAGEFLGELRSNVFQHRESFFFPAVDKTSERRKKTDRDQAALKNKKPFPLPVFSFLRFRPRRRTLRFHQTTTLRSHDKQNKPKQTRNAAPVARGRKQEERRRLAPRQRPLHLVPLPSSRLPGPRPAPPARRALGPLQGARGQAPFVSLQRVCGLRRPQRSPCGGASGGDSDRDAARAAAEGQAAEEAGVLP